MPAHPATERLEARVPLALKRLIQRAADLQGRSITDFAIAFGQISERLFLPIEVDWTGAF
jgi:hypothetical protein